MALPSGSADLSIFDLVLNAYNLRDINGIFDRMRGGGVDGFVSFAQRPVYGRTWAIDQCNRHICA